MRYLFCLPLAVCFLLSVSTSSADSPTSMGHLSPHHEPLMTHSPAEIQRLTAPFGPAPSYVQLRPIRPSVGYGYQRVAQPRPYAYGWFGVTRRDQWKRHFGYHSNYTEWSAGR